MEHNDNPYAYANQPAPQPESWWSRNWKWFVPVGCLVPFLFCCLCPTGLMVFGLNTIKGTPSYQQALNRVGNDPRVTAALGSPLEPGYLVAGDINMTGGSTDATLTFDVTGPNGSATVFLVSTETGGQANYETLTVTIHATGETINLLADPADPQPAEPAETTEPAETAESP